MIRHVAPGLALLAVLGAACAPRVVQVPRPIGGYPTLIVKERVQFPYRSVTVTLPGGASLVADSTIQGESVYCGAVLVGPVTERMCFARRSPNCLSPEATAPPACFPPGSFLEDWT